MPAWKKTARRHWELDDEVLHGEARVEEVEGGFQASIEVTDTDFGMTFMEEEEFFQSRQDALSFVQEKMEDLDRSH